MFSNLKEKRILYLGGTPRAKYVVERAQKLGIYVIVADYTPTNPAKEIADESILVDATDVDKLEQICITKHIDGIFTAYIDVLLPICRELANRLQMSYYASTTMICASTDKIFFKQMCEKYDVPVPHTYNITKYDYLSRAEELCYPVFVKPLDASGSRGAGACYNKEQFISQYEEALSWSKQGVVVVEDLLEGQEFILDYMLISGRPYLTSMADRYVIPGRSLAVNSPNLMVFPSKYLDNYSQKVNPHVEQMFQGENFKDGVIFLQGYASSKSIAFYEMGCRLGGSWPYIDEHYHGINPMDMLFHHAVYGDMLPCEKSVSISADFRGMAAIIYFLSQKSSGEIAKIVGMDEVEKLPYVVHTMQYYHKSDKFDSDRQTDIRFSAVHLVASNVEELKQRVNTIYALVDYIDGQGKSLLMDNYDVNLLEGYDEK